MTEDKLDEDGDGGQANAMAVDTLEDEVEGFIPPNPTSISISPYNTFVDPTRLYFIAVGRGAKTAGRIKTFIHKSSDNQLTTLCSWWNPQSKQWEYIPKGYRPLPLKPPAPTPSNPDEHTMDEDTDSQQTPSNRVDGTGDAPAVQHALDLTPTPYSETDNNWDVDIDRVVPASSSSGSNYSQGVRVRDKQRDKLRERNEKRGRSIEMNTDEEDIVLDDDVLGEGPINDEDDGADATPRAIVADSDEGENSDDENVHRLTVREGKRRQVNNGDSSATAVSGRVGMNSKEVEAGIQDLWITVTEKCRAMGKSPACALKEAGFVISLSRRPNAWNRYRTWLSLQPESPLGM